MNIRKAFVLSVGGIVGAGSIMFVAAKELQIDLSNAIQHITTVVISTGGNKASLSSDRAGNLNVDTNNFIIGDGNQIKNLANGSAIMGGSGNVISGGNNNAILTGESNQISGTNQVIGGGKNNKITGGQNSVIVGGENNIVSAMNSVIIGNNSKVNGAYNITIGQNNNVQGQNNVVMGSGGQTSAQSGFLWAGGKGQGVSGAFVVYANSGMAVNTNTVAGFAKVSIGAPLIVSTGDTASIECNSEYVGTLKLVKKYGNDENSDFKNQMCLCSCNASGWTSLGGNKQCDVPCKNEREFYNPSTNDVDGICGSGLLLQNGTYTGNACLSGYKLIMDSFVLKGERKDNKAVLYWSCQKDEGKTKSCSQNLDNYKCVKNNSYKVFSGDMGLIPVHAHWNNNILPNKSVSVQYNTGNKSALCSFSCNDGYTWVNDNGYDCKKQCTGFDGKKVDHGGTLTGYSSANPICNTECKANTFKCVDGNWKLDGKIIDLKYYYATCKTQTGHIVIPSAQNRDDDAECTTSQNQGTETTMDQGSEMVDDEMRVDTRVDVAPSASEQSASSMGVYPGASSTAQNNINPLAGESSAGLAPIGMDPLPIGNGLGPVQPTYSQYTAGVCKLQASNTRIHKVFSGGAKPSDITTSYLSETCKQYNANGMSCETGVVQELYVCKTGHHWEGNKCVKDTCPATTLKGTGTYSVSTGDVCAQKPLIAVMQWSGSKNGINYVCQATPTCTSAGWNLNEKCEGIKDNCPSPLWMWGSDSAKCVNDSEFAGSSSFGKPKGNIGDFSYKCLKTYLWVLNLPTTCDGVCEGNKVWNGSSCVCEGNKVWNGSSCVCDDDYFLNENGECEEIPDVWGCDYSNVEKNYKTKGVPYGCINSSIENTQSYGKQASSNNPFFTWTCSLNGNTENCALSCDKIEELSGDFVDVTTLHNAYCANYTGENEDTGYEWACYGSCEALKLDFETFIDRCTANVYYRSNLFCNREFWLMGTYDCAGKSKNQCEDASGICKRTPSTTSICVSNDDAEKMRKGTLEGMAEGVRCLDDTVEQVSDCPCMGSQFSCGDENNKTPQCGDDKYTCTVGSPVNKTSDSTSFSWKCTKGSESVSCKIGIQCSQETSGDEDAGYCTGDGGRVYPTGTSTCNYDCIKMCEKTLAGFTECPTCCWQNRQWRVCNDTNKLSCIKEGLCSWISTSSASISLPKFEYCYKEETGSSRQKTSNSGHSRCGGRTCGMTSPVEEDFFACPPNYSINAAGTGCEPAFMYCLSRYYDGIRWYNIDADYCFHKEWRVPGEKPLHEIQMNRPIQQNFHTLNELTITLTSSDRTKKYEFINFFDHYPSYSQTNYTSCGVTKGSLSSYISDGFNRGECQLLKSGNTPNNGYIPDNGYMLFCDGNAGTHMQCK